METDMMTPLESKLESKLKNYAKPFLYWQGVIDPSVAAGSEITNDGAQYRIIVGEGFGLYFEKNEPDLLGQPAWFDITGNNSSLENAILIQALYSKLDEQSSPPENQHSSNKIILEKIMDILQYPQKLLGLREPPIEALWGYITGLRHALELGSNQDWPTFLRNKNFGARTEYNMLDRYPNFETKIKFLQDLFIAYSQFLKSSL